MTALRVWDRPRSPAVPLRLLGRTACVCIGQRRSVHECTVGGFHSDGHHAPLPPFASAFLLLLLVCIRLCVCMCAQVDEELKNLSSEDLLESLDGIRIGDMPSWLRHKATRLQDGRRGEGTRG
eukprot:GHVU01029302.1.p3 GENE.GHVU01029302.1~~GHVU01029302.1.p3  ORF type:complete len:123 (-),score=19.63 GHVU01029302.1:935-1303(-)